MQGTKVFDAGRAARVAQAIQSKSNILKII
jgi:hypothetical protein